MRWIPLSLLFLAACNNTTPAPPGAWTALVLTVDGLD
jgi:hypothetical protein